MSGDHRLVSMDVFYYIEQEYIWFRGGDLNDLRDIRFYEVNGWSMTLLYPTPTPPQPMRGQFGPQGHD